MEVHRMALSSTALLTWRYYNARVGLGTRQQEIYHPLVSSLMRTAPQ